MNPKERRGRRSWLVATSGQMELSGPVGHHFCHELDLNQLMLLGGRKNGKGGFVYKNS